MRVAGPRRQQAPDQRGRFGEAAGAHETRRLHHRVSVQRLAHAREILLARIVVGSPGLRPASGRNVLAFGYKRYFAQDDILARGSARSVGERRLDGRAGVQRAQHLDRRNGVARELRGHVRRDAGEAEHMDAELLPGVARRLEVRTAVVPQAEIEALSRRGALDHVAVALELVADRGANEIGPVGIEALAHQQIDLAEVDVADVDRDLLAVAGLRPQLPHVVGHPATILMPSSWMVDRPPSRHRKGLRPNPPRLSPTPRRHRPRKRTLEGSTSPRAALPSFPASAVTWIARFRGQ